MSAKPKKPAAPATTGWIVVTLITSGQQGESRAGWKVNGVGRKAELLSEFSASVQQTLQGKPVGSSIECDFDEAATAKTLLVKIGAPVKLPGQQPGQQTTVGGGPASDFDSNPYNFAEWQGNEPWLPESGAHDHATHDRWHPDRLSGVLDVTFEARTPVFVPKALMLAEDDNLTPRTFWTCAHPERDERRGIPGSTLKGAVRTLFEIWTNSRLTTVSRDLYSDPIPYRRRSATGYVVVSNDASGLAAVRCCDVKFVRRVGADWKEKKRGPVREETWLPPGPTPSVVDRLRVSVTDRYQMLSGPRLNLLWTPDHRGHGFATGYTHFAVRVGTTRVTMGVDSVQRWSRSLKHEAYTNHPKRVPNGRDYYRRIANEPVDQRVREIANLQSGDLIFGIEDSPGHLTCFGRNVNFMWPANRSPRDLVGDRFMPRDETSANLKGADFAEASFGFAGSTEAFRGRVRFTTFWQSLDDRKTPMAEVSLKPLTSPTGVKLKSRPTYLPRNPETGRAQTFDEVTRFRGRKLYWHQPTTSGELHEAHNASGQLRTPQSPAPIHPMPTGTRFLGQVHFDNLTDMELGALAACLHPALMFSESSEGAKTTYGLKLGKGKPRGLGSVTAVECSLRVRAGAAQCYAALQAQILETQSLEGAVQAFKAYLSSKAADKKWTSLDFVRDLQRLQAIPDGDKKFDYQSEPGDYGWLPKFSQPGAGGIDSAAAKGDPEPHKERPIGMRRAREL